MAKKDAPEFSYDEKTKLYRKKIKNHEGRWIPVYGKTKTELREKIKDKKEEFGRMVSLEVSPYVYHYAKTWYQLNTSELSEKRKEDYKNALNNHILPTIGMLQIHEVKHDHIKEVMKKASALSKSSQQKIVTSLKRLFDSAERNEMIPRSPCRDLKPGGGKPKPKTALTKEQQSILLDAVAGTRAYVFVMIGLYTGMRREEILGLQWDCVHLEDAAPYISVKRALRWIHSQPVVTDALKSRAAKRDIPIPERLVVCLKEEMAKRKGDYVVGNTRGEPVSNASFKSLWGIVRSRSVGTVTRKRKDGDVQVEIKVGDRVPKSRIVATIDFDVSPHVLRHTYITNLVMGGVDVKTVQYLAGHATVAMTLEIYTHLVENRPKDMIERVTAAIDF